jgi:hypothetical protein
MDVDWRLRRHGQRGTDEELLLGANKELAAQSAVFSVGALIGFLSPWLVTWLPRKRSLLA